LQPALVDIPSVVLIFDCIHLRQQLKETCYAVPATSCLTVTDGLMEEPPRTISVPASQQNLYYDNTSLLHKRCHPVDLLAFQWLLPLPASESLTESAQHFCRNKSKASQLKNPLASLQLPAPSSLPSFQLASLQQSSSGSCSPQTQIPKPQAVPAACPPW
jgi:hypothetical protein